MCYRHSPHIWEGFGPSEFSGFAKMDPGYDTSHLLRPPLLGRAYLGLADFIVQRRLFNFFLAEGCIPFTHEHALMSRLVSEAPAAWPRQLSVWGYDDSVPGTCGRRPWRQHMASNLLGDRARAFCQTAVRVVRLPTACLVASPPHLLT